MTIINEIDTVMGARLPFFGWCLLLAFISLFCVLLAKAVESRWINRLALLLSITSGAVVLWTAFYTFPNVEPEYKVVITDMNAVTEEGYEIVDVIDKDKDIYVLRKTD